MQPNTATSTVRRDRRERPGRKTYFYRRLRALKVLAELRGEGEGGTAA